MRALPPAPSGACVADANGEAQAEVLVEVEVIVVAAMEDDEPYDDEKDHTRCGDCKGTGYYIGFLERRLCPTCDGSGFL